MLRVDTDERKIGLSRKRVDWDEDRERAAASEEAAAAGTTTTATKADETELKGGLGGDEGPLFKTRN